MLCWSAVNVPTVSFNFAKGTFSLNIQFVVSSYCGLFPVVLVAVIEPYRYEKLSAVMPDAANAATTSFKSVFNGDVTFTTNTAWSGWGVMEREAVIVNESSPKAHARNSKPRQSLRITFTS